MQITDDKLYYLCRRYGATARLWRQKFVGLLPEVNRRRLYERKGFSSIFEFAYKLCGLSEDQVRLTLNLGKRFDDKPILKAMLEDGEASINKLTRVASIATPENEEELAAKIRVLSVSALSTLVRDEKYARTCGSKSTGIFGGADGLRKPLSEAKNLHVQTAHLHPSRLPVGRQGREDDSSFRIADDVQAELNELHSKGIDVNALLREMLEKRREEIADKKARIVAEIQATHDCGVSADSRYIPARIKKLLHEEFGEKCSISTCKKPAEIIHHTQRFSLSQNHDPRFLAPLCKEHHAIAHSVDLKYHESRALT